MKVYIVFQTTKTTFDYRKKEHLALEAECGGVYDSLDKAVKQCKHELFWVGVATINEDIPEESTDWGECYNHKGQRINGKGELL